MKKILYSVIILSSTVMADIARVEMGVGLWEQNPKGNVSYSNGGADGLYVSSKKNETSAYLWAVIKHPLPVLPNIRLEYVNLEDSGVASGQFKDFTITSASTPLSYKMKQYDIIPYYNILDNTSWITFDLGLDIKIVDGSYSAAPSTPFGGYSDSVTFPIPLLYARARVEIPKTEIGIEADLKYITTGNSTVYDARAKIDYTFDFFPVIRPAFEIGYRVQKIDIDDSNIDAKLNIEFSGVYAGAMVRF